MIIKYQFISAMNHGQLKENISNTETKEEEKEKRKGKRKKQIKREREGEGCCHARRTWSAEAVPGRRSQLVVVVAVVREEKKRKEKRNREKETREQTHWIERKRCV